MVTPSSAAASFAQAEAMKSSSQGVFARRCARGRAHSGPGSLRLLLRQAVERPEPEHKVYGMNANHRTVLEQLA